MSKLEKRIILFAILFVVVYVGAIVVTLKSRMKADDTVARLESATSVSEEEGRLMLAELLAPMAVLFTLAICFILAKKKRIRTYQRLDEMDSQSQASETEPEEWG